MYLINEINALIELLKQDSYFDTVQIICAYPYSRKPTWLKNPVITVSPSDIEADNISIGDCNLYGTYSIDFDVFVPYDAGSPVAQSVIEHIVTQIIKAYPRSVDASQITMSESIKCYKAKCRFTFSGQIEFGG